MSVNASRKKALTRIGIMLLTAGIVACYVSPLALDLVSFASGLLVGLGALLLVHYGFE